MRVIRPVMSALTSTFFLGWIFPLAVTAATRSRRPTVSNRTSTPLSRLALALTITSSTMSTAAPPPNSNLFRLDMSSRSSRLTQAAADRSFERGQGLVVVVRRVHVVALRAQRRDLRIQQLEERSRSHAVALGGELQLLTGGGPVRVLQAYGLECRLQRQECLAHLGLHTQATCPDRFVEIVALRSCL